MAFMTTRRTLMIGAALAMTTALSSPSFADTTLSFLIDNAPNTVAWANQLKTDFHANVGIVELAKHGFQILSCGLCLAQPALTQAEQRTNPG